MYGGNWTGKIGKKWEGNIVMFNFTLSFLHLTNIYRVLKEQETGLNAVEGAEMIQNLIMYGLSYRTHYTLDQREDR